jgi:acetoin utilization deacetylase AcuC-like enzyme
MDAAAVVVAAAERPRLPTGIAHDELMDRHEKLNSDVVPHVERPARTRSIMRALLTSGLSERCQVVPIEPATDAQLSSVHSAAYVARMAAVCAPESDSGMTNTDVARFGMRFNSIFLCRDSDLAARLAAGGVLAVTEQVVTGRLANGFAVVRPPGHHAIHSGAMGFCIYGNVAVAARYARNHLGCKRVLIVDWDIHHGNGTQDMFQDDPSILYVSLHRYDSGFYYPGLPTAAATYVGEGEGRGFSVNIPWSGRGFGDRDYLAAFRCIVMPIAREFDPDLVLISAGFDSAHGDPLGMSHVTPHGYAVMTSMLSELAGGKVVVALEGGYNLRALSASAIAVVQTLLGDVVPAGQSPVETRLMRLDTYSILNHVRGAQSAYWKCMDETVVSESSAWKDLAAEHQRTRETRATSGFSEPDIEDYSDTDSEASSFTSDVQAEESETSDSEYDAALER